MRPPAGYNFPGVIRTARALLTSESVPMAPKRQRPPALDVTVVSDNLETLDELQAYLRRAGVATKGTKHIDGITDGPTTAPSAVVLFPDDFDTEAVMDALATIRKARPSLLFVLVTRDAKRFATVPPGESPILVIPKPAWGWTILDAIRATIDPSGSGRKAR